MGAFACEHGVTNPFPCIECIREWSRETNGCPHEKPKGWVLCTQCECLSIKAKLKLTEPKMNPSTESAESTQVGGDHYRKLKIQPMRYSMENNLNACQHTIIKYVTRYKDRGGILDLEKAKHTIDLLIQFEREKETP